MQWQIVELNDGKQRNEAKKEHIIIIKILMKQLSGICSMNSGLINTVCIEPFRFAAEVCGTNQNNL